MKATVTNAFNDAVLKKHFRVGEPYPVDKVDAERIEMLTKPHPKTGKIYLFIEGEQKLSTEDTQTAETVQDSPPVVEETKPKTTRKKTKPEPSNDGE